MLRLAAGAATPVVPTPGGAVLSRTLFPNSNITIIPFATYSIILLPLHTITKHTGNAINCFKNLVKIRNVHIFSECKGLLGSAKELFMAYFFFVAHSRAVAAKTERGTATTFLASFMIRTD